MKTAKAAVMTGINQPFEVRTYELVPPSAGMAKIKLAASGICGTDLHIHRGKIPVQTPCMIGHEFIGYVEELSAQDSAQYGIRTGDFVIVDIACPCGNCPLCRSGDDANCVHMGVTNAGNPDNPPHFFGGYGEYNYSPVRNLIKIPETLDPKMTSVFACAGPTALHAFRLAGQANCHLNQASVAVVQGLGPVGFFAVLYLAAMGVPNIICITAKQKSARDMAAHRLGAHKILSLEEMGIDHIDSYIREISGGIGADVVFEASGNPAAVAQGMGLLRNRGVYLIPGQYSNSGTIEIPPQSITFNALHIIGSSQYSVSDVNDYLLFMQTVPGLHDDIKRLSKEYTVDEINQAFEDAKSGKNIKTILV